MENMMVSYPTLVVRSLGITEYLVILKIARAKILIMLSKFWTTFFTILGIEINRETIIVDVCVINSSFGKGWRVVIHALKATIHILWVAHEKVLIVVIVTIYIAWEKTTMAMN